MRSVCMYTYLVYAGERVFWLVLAGERVFLTITLETNIALLSDCMRLSRCLSTRQFVLCPRICLCVCDL